MGRGGLGRALRQALTRLDRGEELAGLLDRLEGRPRAGRARLWVEALRALHRGERAELNLLLERVSASGEDGAAEVQAILGLLLAPPSAIEPTSLRREARRTGAGAEVQLPLLDLLKMLAAERAGTPLERVPAALARARKATAEVDLLVAFAQRRGGAQASAAQGRFHDRRTRKLAVMLSTLGVRRAEGSEQRAQLLARHPETFPASEWAELAVDEVVVQAEALLVGDQGARVFEAADAESLSAVPLGTRLAWLGRALRRTEQLLGEGRVDQASLPLGLAYMLLMEGDLLARRPDLEPLSRQVGQVHAQLSMVRGSAPHALLLVEALWRRSASLSLHERREVALQLLLNEAEPADPWLADRLPESRRSAIAFLLGPGYEPGAVRRVVAACAPLVDPPALTAALAEEPADQRDRLLLEFHRSRHEFGPALAAAGRIVGRPESVDEGLSQLAELLGQLQPLEDWEPVEGELAELSSTLASIHPRLAPLVTLVRQVQALPAPQRDVLLTGLRPSVGRALASTPPPLRADLAGAFAVFSAALLLRDEVAAARGFRWLVRRLQATSRPPVALSVALRAALALERELAVSADAGEAGGALEQAAAWQNALTRYLLHFPRELLVERALELDPRRIDMEHLARWAARQGEALGLHPVWRWIEGEACLRRGDEEAALQVVTGISQRHLRGRLGELVADLRWRLDEPLSVSETT